MRDRRKHHRSSIDLLVNKYVGDQPHLCRAVNISRRGMLVHKIFEPDLPIGEVEIEFQLPGDEKVIRVHGVALAEHRESRTQGLRFSQLAPEDAILIDAWLADPDRETATG